MVSHAMSRLSPYEESSQEMRERGTESGGPS